MDVIQKTNETRKNDIEIPCTVDLCTSPNDVKQWHQIPVNNSVQIADYHFPNRAKRSEICVTKSYLVASEVDCARDLTATFDNADVILLLCQQRTHL